MGNNIEKAQNNRLRSSNITVVISIALVLFLLGIFGVIIINAKHSSDYIKEQLTLEVFFKENHDTNIKESKVLEEHESFINDLKNNAAIKKVKYTSKEEAGKIAKIELGVDDHEKFFDEDIFPASASVTLKSEYVQPFKVDSLKNVLQENSLVDEVVNDNDLMITIYENIQKITYWLIGFALIFLLIVVVLINNSIRLKIYSKRFLIKTMQLVGARRSFIIKPFLVEGFLLGLISSIIAIAMLGGLWYYFVNVISLGISQDYIQYIFLAIVLIVLGVSIAILSTLYATWRFLHIRTDKLYY